MQAVEVAYELRDYTDYCIGSPTEIPGPGASYDAVVPAMFSAENAAVNIAKAYYELMRLNMMKVMACQIVIGQRVPLCVH